MDRKDGIDNNEYMPKVASENSLTSGSEDSTTRLNTWLNAASANAVSNGGDDAIVQAALNGESLEFSASSDLPPHSSPPPGPPPPKTNSALGESDAPANPKQALAGVLRNSPKPPLVGKKSAPAVTTIDSAAQDASMPPAKPMPERPSHERNVSWGDKQNAFFQIPGLSAGTSPSTKTPEASPILAFGARSYSPDSLKSSDFPGAEISPPAELVQPALSTQTSFSQSSINSPVEGSNIVDMDDLLKINPLESEAETLIIRAIEKQDAIIQESKHKRGQSSANSNLLGNVPMNSVDIFMPSQEQLAAPSSTTLPPRKGSMDSTGVKEVTRGRPRLNTIDNSSVRKLPKPAQIKRNQTTEVNLANLTLALAGVHHGEGMNDDDAASLSRPRTPAKGSKDTAASSGETLALNADALFRNQKSIRKLSVDHSEADESSSVPSVVGGKTTGGQGWGKLRSAVKASSAAASLIKPAAAPTEITPKPKLPPSGSVLEKVDTTNVSVQQLDDIQEDIEDGMMDPSENSVDHLEDTTERTRNKKKKRRRGPQVQSGVARDFQIFVGQKSSSLYNYVRLLLLVVFPAAFVASMLFYVADNPPIGRISRELSSDDILVNTSTNVIDPRQASVSWWIIFVCIRQVLTFSIAQLVQLFVVDFLCLSTRLVVSLFGNLVTLLIVQSKGWPFVLTVWSLLDFALLHGSSPLTAGQSRFAAHWLYWQNWADICNKYNPGGDVVSNTWNTTVLSIGVGVGVSVGIKRLWLGLYLGKKTYSNYADELSKVVKKVLTLCEVAAIARECLMESYLAGASQRAPSVSRFGMTRADFDEIMQVSMAQDAVSVEKGASDGANDSSYNGGYILDPKHARKGFLDQAQKSKITELLGAWEDPEDEMENEENVSISGILHFRQSLTFLENRYMFSLAWGDVSTRDRMVVSSQEVYRKLLLRSPNPNILKFDVLARAAIADGVLDQRKLKDLIRLLRPDRDGNLSVLEFVKSVDNVFKEAKLLRASVRNNEKIDRAFENAFNVVFYVVAACIILSQLGFDPVALFISLSSLIVAFAFMIGSASAKMFEGFLFILIRRPYNIGDRIHISNPEAETSGNGSAGWIVKDVTLFTTTAVFATTGERATIANGSIAASRVINMARSPNAVVYINLKFSVSVKYDKIQIFEQALRQFVKDRPREWANFAAFRAVNIMADQGYIEYVTILQHREAWQNVGSILVSKAEVSSFCLELSKKLEMKYQSPPLPVDLAVVQNRSNSVSDSQSMVGESTAGYASDPGFSQLAAMFNKKSV